MSVTRSGPCGSLYARTIPVCAAPPPFLSAGADIDRCHPAGGCLALVRVKRMEKRSHDKKPRPTGARPVVRPAPVAPAAVEEPREAAVEAGAAERDQVVTTAGGTDIAVRKIGGTPPAHAATPNAHRPRWT